MDSRRWWAVGEGQILWSQKDSIDFARHGKKTLLENKENCLL